MLASLSDALRRMHRATAEAVELAGRVRPRRTPTLTAATVDALCHDADMRVVLFDGAGP